MAQLIDGSFIPEIPEKVNEKMLEDANRREAEKRVEALKYFYPEQKEERNEIPDSVVEEAWKQAEEKCENCCKQLIWENRGREGRGCWEAHHKETVQDATISNCQILCFECHSETF